MRKGAKDEINLGYIICIQQICNEVKRVALLKGLVRCLKGANVLDFPTNLMT